MKKWKLGLLTALLALSMTACSAKETAAPEGYLINASVYMLTLTKSAEEMLEVVVGASATGAPVYLKDVAVVNDGEQERLQKERMDRMNKR